jgi:hypothetical protein
MSGWTCALVSCEHPVLDACAAFADNTPVAAEAPVTENPRTIAEDTLNNAIDGRIARTLISNLFLLSIRTFS